MVIYSTPCLFSARKALEAYLHCFAELGRLPDEGTVTIKECNNLLHEQFISQKHGPAPATTGD
jgi:hypothetical protein